MTTFNELGLDPLLLKALETEGYTTPTPIQAQAIPSILEGKDLLGVAQTGTGKTAAFALPILQRLAANRQPALRRGVRALILSPTRELATQIAESFRTYGRHMGISVAVVYGGVAHKPQRDALNRGVDVLVATPGRLLDHMGERNVVLEGTEILVLDEADQMMDLGFIRPLRQIISKLSHRRQSLFFSATMPHEIGALAAELLRDPVKVSVSPVTKTADRVAQQVIFVEQTKKRSLLVELFANPDLMRAIVFTRTKRGADRVARYLETSGIPVSAIHGNKSQGQRDAALGGFKAGRIRALIATDIAARGIDVDAVSHVINYEIPNVPESYVHRIGRTARAGAEGIAISLVDNEERGYLRDIERLTRQQIPSQDRRGDTSLVAPTETAAERSAERAERAMADRRGAPRAHRGSEGRGHSRPDSRGSKDGPRAAHFKGAQAAGESRGPSRPEYRGHNERPRPARADGAPSGGEGRGPDRREARPERSFEDRRSSERPAQRRDEPRRDEHRADRTRPGRADRPERNAQDRKGQDRKGQDRNGQDRSGQDRSGQDRSGHDRRPHSAEGRHRPASAHRDAEASHGHGAARGAGSAKPHGKPQGSGAGRPADRSHRSAAPGKGLEGVKFLANRGDRPRARPSGPRADDRRKAPSRPA